MPRKRLKTDEAFSLLAMRNVPMDVARKVVDALPDLEYPTERWAWRYDLNKARIEVFGDILCTVELTMTDGSIYEWHIARPQRVLRFLASQSDALKRIIQGMPSSPEKPLTILHYHDEVTPGHLLAPQHSWMFTSFRFAFEEIGRYLLTCEDMWFEYAVLRTTVLKMVKGGMSAVMAKLMHVLFTCSSEG